MTRGETFTLDHVGRLTAALLIAVLGAAMLAVPLAWAEDGRMARRDRAARLARRVLDEVARQPDSSPKRTRGTSADGEFDVRVYVDRDVKGATVAWVDVLDARHARADPLAALLAHRSLRVTASVRDASL